MLSSILNRQNEGKMEKELQNQKGFTLLEMMMVIVISLLLMAGVFGLANMAMGNNKIKDAQQNISTIRMGVQNLYSGQPNYTGLDNDIGKNAGIFPDKMNNSGTIKNGWDGSVTIATASSNNKFTISYDGVPQEACMKLTVLNGFDGIHVGSVSGTGITSISDANSECSSSGNKIIYISQ